MMKKKKKTQSRNHKTALAEYRSLLRALRRLNQEKRFLGEELLEMTQELKRRDELLERSRLLVRKARAGSVFDVLANLQTRGKLLCFSGTSNLKLFPFGQPAAELQSDRDAELCLRVLKQIAVAYGGWLMENKETPIKII